MELRSRHFAPKEARELSVLPKSTPALRAMIVDRISRRERFEKLAASKIASGKWKRSQVSGKWVKNLSRLYSKYRLRVKFGPKGKQDNLGGVGAINPWALYRHYVRSTGGQGGQGHVSPWELRQVKRGKTRLEKGLVFVQRAERQAWSGKGVSQATVRDWIAQKDEAIRQATGRRKAQLMIERNRLERML